MAFSSFPSPLIHGRSEITRPVRHCTTLMEVPPGSADGRRAVGSLPPYSGLAPSLPHHFDSQLPMSTFSSPAIHPMYHPHAAHTPYIPMNWHVSMVQPNSQSARSTVTRRSPGGSEDGDSRTESASSQRSGSFSTAAQRTLFIAGFPADVKEREIYNLLRFQPGFVDCSLTPGVNGKQVRSPFSTSFPRFDTFWSLRAEVGLDDLSLATSWTSFKVL